MVLPLLWPSRLIANQHSRHYYALGMAVADSAPSYRANDSRARCWNSAVRYIPSILEQDLKFLTGITHSGPSANLSHSADPTR